jgi:hypothetical protein
MALAKPARAIFIWPQPKPKKETVMAKRRRHSSAGVAHLKKASTKRHRKGGMKRSAIKA